MSSSAHLVRLSLRTALLTVVTALAVAMVGAAPAQAKGRDTLEVHKAQCFGATAAEPWGGISVDIRLDRKLPPEGEPYLVVVDDAEGRAIDRFFSDTPRYRSTFRVAGDGLTQTPALRITAAVGGDVLGTATVDRRCGTLNPNPLRAPVIGPVSVVGCDVSVTVTNPNTATEFVLVALWPEGSNVAPLEAVELAGGASGVVVFEAQGTGTYSVQADGADTFLRSETPYDIVVPEGCVAAA